MNKFYIHPSIRIYFAVVFITGTILTNNLELLSIAYLFIILPVTLLTGISKEHFRLFIFGMVPVFLSFILLYKLILSSSWLFIGIKMLKILNVTSILQLSLSIPRNILLQTLNTWKLNNQVKITIIGAFSVWSDIATRTNLILTARFSRGFVPRRNLLITIKQTPYVFIPLITGIIRSSIDRASSWDEKNILVLIDNFEIREISFPLIFNIFLALVSSAWLIIGILSQLR